MSTKASLTIGIPAYNEEANIAVLINELLEQKSQTYVLESIVVASDGSSDRTVEIVKSFNSNRVQVLDNKDRKGAAARQNQLIEYADSDILVLMNADIKLGDSDFIQKLVDKIQEGADLVSPNMLCVPPTGVFESIVAFGLHLKNHAFENYKKGNNIYTCHGAARAFSKQLYKKFRFATSISEDANSYLYAVTNGFKYAYADKATCYIKSAGTYKDHLRQSTRNFNGMKILQTKYEPSVVKKAYHLPLAVVAKAGLVYFVKNPLKLVIYGVLIVSTFLGSKFIKSSQVWEISKSSKVLK